MTSCADVIGGCAGLRALRISTGPDRFSQILVIGRYRFDGVPTVQGERSAMAVPERVSGE